MKGEKGRNDSMKGKKKKKHRTEGIKEEKKRTNKVNKRKKGGGKGRRKHKKEGKKKGSKQKKKKKKNEKEYRTEWLSRSVHNPQRYKPALRSEIAPLQFYHQPQSGDNASSSCRMLFTRLCSGIILAMIDNNSECINGSARHAKVILLKWLAESSATVSNVHVGSSKWPHMPQIRLLCGPSRMSSTISLSPNDGRQHKGQTHRPGRKCIKRWYLLRDTHDLKFNFRNLNPRRYEL